MQNCMITIVWTSLWKDLEGINCYMFVVLKAESDA